MGAHAAQVMIVGNKSDLAGSREVSYEEAAQLASNYGISYMECSAKSGDNIEGVFGQLAERMKAKFIDELIEQPRKADPLRLPANSIKERCCNT